MKILIPTLKDCLVIYEIFKRHILCFELNTVENYAFLEGVFEAARDENFRKLVSKEKKKRRKDGRTNIRDVHASWKKAKCLYLYSTDTAFAQHKHDILCKQKVKNQRKGDFPKARETSS